MIEQIREFNSETEVRHAAFSPDGRWLALATEGKVAELWDVQAATKGPVLHGHTDKVWTVTFAPDGSTIATGSADGTVRIWEADGLERAVLKGHHNAVTWAMFSPDGRRLATSGWDKRLIIWDVASGKIQAEHNAGATFGSGGFSADGSRLLTGSNENQAELWNSENGELVNHLTGSSADRELRAAVSRDGRIAFTAEPFVRIPPGEPGKWLARVGVWDASAWCELSHFEVDRRQHAGLWHLAAARDGRFVLLGASDGQIKVARATGGVYFEGALSSRDHGPSSLALSADDNLLASAVKQSVRLWRVNVPDWPPPVIQPRRSKPWWRFW